MKNSLFYGIVALAIIAFLVGIISYATDILPKQRGNITAPIQTTVSGEKKATVKKKSCGCCTERMALRKQQIQKARARRQTAQNAKAKELVLQQTPERASSSP